MHNRTSRRPDLEPEPAEPKSRIPLTSGQLSILLHKHTPKTSDPALYHILNQIIRLLCTSDIRHLPELDLDPRSSILAYPNTLIPSSLESPTYHPGVCRASHTSRASAAVHLAVTALFPIWVMQRGF